MAFHSARTQPASRCVSTVGGSEKWLRTVWERWVNGDAMIAFPYLNTARTESEFCLPVRRHWGKFPLGNGRSSFPAAESRGRVDCFRRQQMLWETWSKNHRQGSLVVERSWSFCMVGGEVIFGVLCSSEHWRLSMWFYLFSDIHRCDTFPWIFLFFLSFFSFSLASG